MLADMLSKVRPSGPPLEVYMLPKDPLVTIEAAAHAAVRAVEAARERAADECHDWPAWRAMTASWALTEALSVLIPNRFDPGALAMVSAAAAIFDERLQAVAARLPASEAQTARALRVAADRILSAVAAVEQEQFDARDWSGRPSLPLWKRIARFLFPAVA